MEYYDLWIRVRDDGDILAISTNNDSYDKPNLGEKEIDLVLTFIEERRG